jgi:endoglucanase
MARTTRIRIALELFAVAAAVLQFVIPAHAAGADTETRFCRGIGLSHAMAWARIEPGPARVFAFPPFSDPGNALTAEELRTLRDSGFDFVRLAVDPGPFLQFQGTRRDALDRILTDRVSLVLTSGLSIIVDFHPSDLHPDYLASTLTAGLDAPLFRAYLLLLERTAGLLGELHSNKVALELMNEPPVRPYVWQPMLEAGGCLRGGAAPCRRSHSDPGRRRGGFSRGLDGDARRPVRQGPRGVA